jgi:hypothetical protein
MTNVFVVLPLLIGRRAGLHVSKLELCSAVKAPFGGLGAAINDIIAIMNKNPSDALSARLRSIFAPISP